VRVLLDENLPHDLIAALVGHSVSTVQGLGWDDISVLPFGVVVVGAPSNRMSDLMPLVPEMLAALDRVRPGKVEYVGRAGRRRDRMKET
jgi:hypothetical protein